MAQIHELLPEVAASIGAVAKTRVNQAQQYAFRGIDDFLNAVHGALGEHQVSMLPEVLDHRTEFRARDRGVTTHVFVTMKYTFYAPDGSNVAAITVGEAADTSDKATNKAMSAALKYAIMQTFTVPTVDIADSDRETPDMGDRPYEDVLLVTVDEVDDLRRMFDGIEDEQARGEAKRNFLKAFDITSVTRLPAAKLVEAQKFVAAQVKVWLEAQPPPPPKPPVNEPQATGASR